MQEKINGNIGEIKVFKKGQNKFNISSYGLVELDKNKLIIDGSTDVEYEPNILQPDTEIVSTVDKTIFLINDIIDGHNDNFLIFTHKILIENKTIKRNILLLLEIDNGLTEKELSRLNFLTANFTILNDIQKDELQLLFEKKEKYIEDKKKYFI